MSSEKIRVIILFAFFAALVAFAVTYSPTSALSRPADQRSPVLPIGKPLQIKVPLGLPPLPVPADNPPTAETVALGRRLYYDPALSADNTISCASCHSPQAGFTDRNKFSLGVGQKMGTRHSPTVINSAYCAFQFWDGRAPTLEEQAKGPIANPVEMANTHDAVVSRLKTIKGYAPLFKQAFGSEEITIDRAAMAIATFERTIVSGNAPYDRYKAG